MFRAGSSSVSAPNYDGTPGPTRSLVRRGNELSGKRSRPKPTPGCGVPSTGVDTVQAPQVEKAALPAEKAYHWLKALAWLVGQCSRRGAASVIILAALALCLPALGAPLIADDHVQALKWRDYVAGGGSYSLSHILNDYFRFIPGDRESNLRLLEYGVGAWWGSPDLKLALWRPFAALTHVLDHLLWNGNSVLMHLHSLLWFVALLVLLHRLYGRLLPPKATNVALALYAWDSRRGMVLSWVANRNALIAAVFGVLTLIALDKWRKERWRPGMWLAPTAFTGALLAAEIGVSSFGFLLGYMLCLDQGPLRKRLLRLGPFVGILALWQTYYLWSGFGITNSGFYHHPFHEPLGYLAHLVPRAIVLCFAQLTPFISDLWLLLPPGAALAVGLLAAAVLFAIARLSAKYIGADSDTRAWLIGAVLALGPISATFPSDRNLTFVGIGAAPLLARLFVGIIERPPVMAWDRLLTACLAATHLGLAPLLLPLRALSTVGPELMFAKLDADVPSDAAITQKTLVVIRANSEGGIAFNWKRREVRDTPRPHRTRILGLTMGPITVTRQDTRTLRLRAKSSFLDSDLHWLGRDVSQPFHVADSVILSDMVSTVTEVTDTGLPRTVEFRFATPLDYAEWLWMQGKGMRLVPWTVPPIGESVIVQP